MKDRILKIINREQLTASKFADILGVQRSSVSHILSGRNKPSLDFVQRILQEFKTINSDWLLFGTGDMYKKEAMPSLFEDNKNTVTNVNQVSNEIPGKQFEEHNFANQQVTKGSSVTIKDTIKKENLTTENNQVKEEPTISKIFSKSSNKVIVFFSDNTFKEYSPAE
jgi:transcriptional regulator with XRE-family HTH domain